MDTFGTKKPAGRSWRRHSEEFKARVIELARQPHTSVAAVALANGLNANMLRRWVREAEPPGGDQAGDRADEVTAKAAFVQLPMLVEQPALAPDVAPMPTAQAAPAAPAIFVEIHRGDTSVYVSLPPGSDSAAWLREVLA